MFFINITNIKKALIIRIKINPYIKLLEYYSKFLGAFNYLEAEKLLLLYSPGTNYTIKLEKVNRKELIVL